MPTFRVEIRTDIEATDADDAERQASNLAARIDGEVTELLDENWNEV